MSILWEAVVKTRYDSSGSDTQRKSKDLVQINLGSNPGPITYVTFQKLVESWSESPSPSIK